jgi:murein DD-endopeptidase MepM/ murein hydrolase activator NlpD
LEKDKESRYRYWLRKLRDKYRLVIMNDQTFEEKISIRLSRLNVFVLVGGLSIFLVFLTTYIIAFTPLREFIPGYMDVGLSERIYELQQRADSLEQVFGEKDLYIYNLRQIMEGKEIVDRIPEIPDTSSDVKDIPLSRSSEDSMLRREVEMQRDQYSGRALGDAQGLHSVKEHEVSSFLFYTPIKGIIVNFFDPLSNHYGIDIVTQRNEPVKAVYDGHVVFSDWTLETGYVIGIAHSGDLISVYKHNSSLLRRQGQFVRAGDPIAIVGNSGELTSGPHLHFELWHNGQPVNPQDYISF